MGTILPAEISEFLVNSLESHDDESDRTKKLERGQRGTIFRAGVGNTYGYAFVWKREKRKEEERGGKWAGGCLWGYYQYTPRMTHLYSTVRTRVGLPFIHLG